MPLDHNSHAFRAIWKATFLTVESHLKKLNFLILLLLTIQVQNTFKISQFGLNFVSNLAKVEESKVHYLMQYFSSK